MPELNDDDDKNNRKIPENKKNKPIAWTIVLIRETWIICRVISWKWVSTISMDVFTWASVFMISAVWATVNKKKQFKIKRQRNASGEHHRKKKNNITMVATATTIKHEQNNRKWAYFAHDFTHIKFQIISLNIGRKWTWTRPNDNHIYNMSKMIINLYRGELVDDDYDYDNDNDNNTTNNTSTDIMRVEHRWRWI